jgi:hypothetical protein
MLHPKRAIVNTTTLDSSGSGARHGLQPAAARIGDITRSELGTSFDHNEHSGTLLVMIPLRDAQDVAHLLVTRFEVQGHCHETDAVIGDFSAVDEAPEAAEARVRSLYRKNSRASS